MGLRIGRISRLLSPGYGACEKCKTTWNFVEPHSVDLTWGHGTFALCEKCWDESTEEERVHYHYQVWIKYHSGIREWEPVEEAVREDRQFLGHLTWR